MSMPPPKTEDAKEKRRNPSNHTSIEEIESRGAAHKEASLLYHHGSCSPGTVATSTSSFSLTPEVASHRLLAAKASISRSQMGSSLGQSWDAHRFSLESLDDSTAVEIENTPSSTTDFHDSLATLTASNNETENRSFSTVEWVNNLGGISADSSQVLHDDENWEDMERAIAESLYRGTTEESGTAHFSATTPTIAAVVVDDEEERHDINTESGHIAAPTAVQAEVVDLNKRRVAVGSALVIALAIILSLATTLVATKSNAANPSISPTAIVVQHDEWVEIANDASLSEVTLVYPAVSQPSSGEKALAWLIEESGDVIKRRALQRFAFVLLAFSWNNPEWNITAQFDECDLKGVTCDGNNSCVEMDLTAAGLTGTIPPEIALLSDLRKLVLWDNSLTGRVPWEPMLHRLHKMEFLDLDINELTGPLPSPKPGTWPLIEIFWVAKNQITGTISPGFAYWPVLEDLYVRDNLLTGTIPTELGTISTMNWFAVDDNDLHGTLPTEIGGWTSINHFEVEGSQRLTGTIPTEVGRWSIIQDFLCNMNKFNGTLPTEIGEWTRIKQFRAEFNSFSGPLPTGMSSWTKLTTLFLDNNNFTGTLPSGIANWTLLKEVQLNNNRLVGSLSPGLDSWKDLKRGSFQMNGFSGSLNDLCNGTGDGTIVSADCCEVGCLCCSSCFVDDGIPGPNCSLPFSVEP